MTKESFAGGDAFVEPVKVTRNLKRKLVQVDKKEDEAYEFLKVAASAITKKDDASIFGEMVASEIRKLTQRNTILAKQKIINTIFELQMTQMEDSSSSVSNTSQVEVCPSTFNTNSFNSNNHKTTRSPITLVPATVNLSNDNSESDKETEDDGIDQYLIFDFNNRNVNKIG